MAKKLREYHAMWEIEVDGTSAREAAKRALKIMQDPGSTATVFDVTPTEGKGAGKTTRIDLEE